MKQEILTLTVLWFFVVSVFLVSAERTIEQCVETAKSEILKKLPEFSNKLVFYKSYQSVMPDTIDIYFHRSINNILSIDERVRVGVNTKTGEVILFQSFLGDLSDPKVDTTPKISKEVAICAAINVYPDVDSNQEPELMLSGVESPALVWKVKWHNTPLLVNARTGRVDSIPVVEGVTPAGEGICSPDKVVLITAKQYVPYMLVAILVGLAGLYFAKPKLFALLRK